MNIKKLSSCLCVLVLLGFAHVVSAAQNWINEIRSNSLEDKLQIVVDVAEKPDYNVFTLSSPIRLVLDVAGVPSSEYENNLSFKNRGVSLVRTGMDKPDRVRLVVEMLQDFKWTVYPLPPSEKRGHRIVIEVFDYPKSKTTATDKKPDTTATLELTTAQVQEQAPKLVLESFGSPGSAAPQKPVIPVQKASVPKTVPSKKTPTVTTAKKQSVPKKPAVKISKRPSKPQKVLVMIDPGHGGKDSGAIGPRKTQEKRVVLAIAKRLQKKINAVPGMRAILTRSSDRYISLRGRLALAQKHKPDLFVSIHADSFVKPTAHGSSVFILSNRGASSEAARWLAKRENAVDLKYGVDIGDYDKDVSNFLIQMQQDATIESSHALANATLAKLKGVGKVHKRHVERAGFAVLKSPDIPSMLVETAFISNPGEEKKLRSPAYQNKLAEAITLGIKKYFSSRASRQQRLSN